MKTLRLYRHSLKGPDKLLTPKGLLLAYEAGKSCEQQINAVACGYLPRTGQTMLAFMAGLLCHQEVVPENISGHPTNRADMGCDDVFAEMITPGWQEASNSGLNDFAALVAAHDRLDYQGWGRLALSVVRDIFNCIYDGQTAAGFYHSPTVQLAAWMAMGCEPEDLPSEIGGMKEMQGVMLVETSSGDIRCDGLIPAPSLD